MIPESMYAPISGFVGVIVGAIITYFTAVRTAKMKGREAFLKRIADETFDIVVEIDKTIKEACDLVNLHANRNSINQKEYEKVDNSIEKYIETKKKAALFLSNDDVKKLNELMGSLRTCKSELLKRLQDKNHKLSLEYWDFIEKHDNVLLQLKNRLGIDTLHDTMDELRYKKKGT